MTDSNYWQRVAAEIRAEMAKQRKSTADLALVLGVHKETARGRRRGDSPFTLPELEKVALWLDVPIGALAGSEAVA